MIPGGNKYSRSNTYPNQNEQENTCLVESLARGGKSDSQNHTQANQTELLHLHTCKIQDPYKTIINSYPISQECINI